METSVLVLLVEDDHAIQELLLDTLLEAGFEVVQASNAEGAINILDQRKADLRAVVTDIDFGDSKMTGWDVARRAREFLNELPVVYMTGASADAWGSKGVPNSVLINKPFVPAQVVTALSQLLNAGDGATSGADT